MKGNRNFDEVMIANPAVAPFGANQGVTPMSFRAAEPPEMGYYAEEEPGYGYFAEEYPVEGYGFADPAGYYGDEYVLEPVGYYGGCPMPTNGAGFGEPENFEGYVQPATVNATCDRFTAQPGTTPGEPETFRPLW